MKNISVRILTEDEDLIPRYGSMWAAGADLCSASKEEIVIAPGKTALIPTGIKLEIPEGYEVQIRPRSGLAAKHQVTILNAPGTIDSDYRGEIKVIMINHGEAPFVITHKMRIAQMVLQEVTRAEFHQEEALSSTKRGEGGFGHTGTH